MYLKYVMFVQLLSLRHNMNTNLVQIEDSSYVRDIHSKAILNTDLNGLNEYYMKREMFKKEQAEKIQMNNRLDNIENDMSEIKNLLRDIVSLRKE